MKGALDRLAGRRIDDEEAKVERSAGFALGEVAPHLLARDVVRTLGQFRREYAGDRTGCDRAGAGAGCRRRLGNERGGDQAARRKAASRDG
jgi:hypothetical protein